MKTATLASRKVILTFEDATIELRVDVNITLNAFSLSMAKLASKVALGYLKDAQSIEAMHQALLRCFAGQMPIKVSVFLQEGRDKATELPIVVPIVRDGVIEGISCYRHAAASIAGTIKELSPEYTQHYNAVIERNRANMEASKSSHVQSRLASSGFSGLDSL